MADLPSAIDDDNNVGDTFDGVTTAWPEPRWGSDECNCGCAVTRGEWTVCPELCQPNTVEDQISTLQKEVTAPTSADSYGQLDQAAIFALRAFSEEVTSEVDLLMAKFRNDLMGRVEQLLEIRETEMLESRARDRPGLTRAQKSVEEALGAGPHSVSGLLNGKSDKSEAQTSRKKVKKRRHAGDCIFEADRNKVLTEQTRLQSLVTSHAYETVSCMLILLNALYIGAQTQVHAENVWHNINQGLTGNVEESVASSFFEWLFAIAFCFEVGLRWTADGLFGYFRTSDLAWNFFDVSVVGLGLLDIILQQSNAGSHANISVLRVMRIIRIVRVARVIRVMRFFRELRIMIVSIIGSFKALLWVAVILIMIFYIFGISFTLGAVGYLQGAAEWELFEQEHGQMQLYDHIQKVHNYFGSVDRALLSLYMSMSGGIDWSDAYTSLELLGGTYRVFFLIFVSFSVFAVLNIVTGVFVESAMQSNKMDRTVVVHEELEQKKRYLTEMRAIFEEMDADDTGCITQKEFETHLADERVMAYFNALKLDVSDAKNLFRLLDYDKSGEIGIGEFLSGCYRLQGQSRALDMAIMQYEVSLLSQRLLGPKDRDITDDRAQARWAEVQLLNQQAETRGSGANSLASSFSG